MDQITYGVKAVGHDSPESERKYVKPEADLKAMFETWLATSKRNWEFGGINHYDIVAELVSKLQRKVSVDEAHSLLLEFQEYEDIDKAGLFISALYNQADDKIIVFDITLDKPVNYLATRLKEKKVFVNKGLAGTETGSASEGILINYQRATHFGMGVKAPLLNYGTVIGGCGKSSTNLVANLGTGGYNLGRSAQRVVLNFGHVKDSCGEDLIGTVIQCGTTENFFGNRMRGRLIAVNDPQMYGFLGNAKVKMLPEECAQMPELLAYFNDLKQKFEQGRTDHLKAIEALTTITCEQIEKDLESIINKNMLVRITRVLREKGFVLW